MTFAHNTKSRANILKLATTSRDPGVSGSDQLNGDSLQRLEAADWFMLRTPVLPFDSWLQWTHRATEQQPTADGLAKAKQRLREGLRDHLTPVFLEGIYLASPVLSERLPEWFRDPETRTAQRIESSLSAYFSRMTGRPAPFGVFSIVQAGQIGAVTNLALPGKEKCERKTRISVRYLRELSRAALQRQDFRGQIRYKLNPTLYIVGEQAHYLKRTQVKDCASAFSVATCKTSPLLEEVWRVDSEISIPELTDRLLEIARRGEGSKDCESSRSNLLEFIEGLIRAQVLIPEAGPILVGRPYDPIDSGTGLLMEGSSACDDLRSELDNLDATGVGAPVGTYRALAAQLWKMADGSNSNEDGSAHFFVDLIRPTPRLSLQRSVADEIVQAVDLLRSVSRDDDATWKCFSEKFVERFGTDEVPLLEVFDAGFDFSFDRVTAAQEFKQRDAHLLKRVFETIGQENTVLELSDSDLAFLRRNAAGELPAGFAVLSTLIASSELAIAQGDYQIVVDGITRAGGILGRFASFNSEWYCRVSACIEREQRCSPGAVMADVVYDPPETSLSNVICRPALTHYVIPFFGGTSVPADRQIRLADLAVSVCRAQTLLWSRRLGSRVIPVLNSAYAFHHSGSPAVLRFLCKLAMGTSNVAWSWGEILETLPFLPRLSYGRLVLSRARWLLSSHEVEEMQSLPDRPLMKRLEALRQQRRLPRFLLLVQQSRRLAVDLENILSARMLLRLTRGQNYVELMEMLPPPDQLCVHSAEGRFHHELVLPLGVVSTTTKGSPLARPHPVEIPCAQRRALPGSHWLYVKVYTRESTLDTVLIETVSALVQLLAQKQILRQWFFIRYTDPYLHLRVRFLLERPEDTRVALDVLTQCLNPLLPKALLWKWQIDTYVREIERYGTADIMRQAELIFCADSAFAVRALGSFSTMHEREELRLPLCLLSIERLLEDFGLDLQARLNLVSDLKRGLSSEIEQFAQFKVRLAAEFRAERNSLLAAGRRLELELFEALQERSLLARPSAAIIQDLQEDPAVTVKEVVHLTINRLMKAVNRKQELKIYDFLERFYASCVARGVTRLFEVKTVPPGRPDRLRKELQNACHHDSTTRPDGQSGQIHGEELFAARRR